MNYTNHIIIAIFSLLLCLPLHGQNNVDTENDVKESAIMQEAQRAYNNGDFASALKILKAGALSNDELLAADCYHLMALCHIEFGDIKSAESDIDNMIRKNPYFTISTTENPIFSDLLKKQRTHSATIVTASQQAESIDESPVPVTLITREMIEASGANNLQDVLLLYIPGLSKIEGIETNVAMRGVYADSQEHMLIMQNGHRLNSQSTNVEAIDYRSSLDKIDHIEVLRGPASSLYGNVALTGVVNIITRNGTELNGNQASVKYGSNSTLGINLMRGKGGLRNDYLFWANMYKSDGEKKIYEIINDRVTYSQIDRYNNLPSFDIGTRVHWDDLTFSVNMQHSKRVPYENLVQVNDYTYDKYGYNNGTKPGTSRLTLNIATDYNHTWRNLTFSASLLCNYERYALYNVNTDSCYEGALKMLLSIGGMDDIPMFDTEGIWETLAWHDFSVSANVSGAYSYSFGNQSGTVLAGIQFDYFTLAEGSLTIGNHFNQALYKINSIFESGAENMSSAFLQLKHRFSQRLIFNGGIRYDYKNRFDDEKHSIISPRTSLILQLNKLHSIRASYAQSFVDAPYLYRACKMTFFHGELSPQKLYSLQLGINGNLPTYNIKWELNGFYDTCKDLVIIAGSLGNGLTSDIITNAGESKIGGIEGIVTYQTPKTLATLNATYQHPFQYTELASNNFGFIPNAPKFIANATFAQRLLMTKHWGTFWFRTNVHLQSKTYMNTFKMFIKMIQREATKTNHNYGEADLYNTEQPFVCTANAGLEWCIKKLQIGIDVYNIFNTDYSIGSRTNIPQPQQSRHFLAKASFTF